ncbi:IclR family transcriptional regulator [Herbidospora daliensis]|uniref:IclR family transcriptional regulator n=1 Tax=Herbidospora daliensis TaxID=295585 RepID=UPI000780806B|nr:IclR family transcriptional regulator [Herbidospora daliensis]
MERIGTLAKAMIVLRTLATSPEPVSLTTLARQVQMPKSTVHRLLAALEADDLVGRTGADYRVAATLRTYAQPDRVRHFQWLRRMATPHLLELYENTRQIVSIAVLTDRQAEYVMTLYPRTHTKALWRTAELAPAHCTAAGKVLLAYQGGPPDLRVPLRRHTDRTITDPGVLDRQLAVVRRRGVAWCVEEYVQGLSAIAVPVLGVPNFGVVAVGVSGPVKVLQAGPAEAAVRRAGHELAVTLRTARLAG